MKTILKYLLIGLVVSLFLTQLQPLVLRAAGAVDGTFGIRPKTHQCLGLTLEAEGAASRLPAGDVEFRLGFFHFRYSVSEEAGAAQRPICVGQDIWFGE
jgi:hypothetical protein